MVKNIANKSKTSTTNNCTAAKIDRETAATIVKPTFVPIKDKIKQMEQQSHSEKSEFEQRFKEVTTKTTTTTTTNSELIQDVAEANGNHPDEGDGGDRSIEESDQPGEITPPKPMPRTSRNNSVSEQLSGAGADEPQVVAAPRPVARPRTTATGYKV